MLDPDTMAHGAEASYPNGFAYYVVGRGGVLGDVDSDVVYSAFMFFERSLIDQLELFISPAEKLISQVDSSGLSLFAGLRAEPLPSDLPARAYRLITLIRELRGCLHIAACVTHQLSGLEASLVSSGEGLTKLHGWAPPYPDVSHLVAARDAAEKATNDAMARLIALHLTEAEMNQLAEQTTRACPAAS